MKLSRKLLVMLLVGLMLASGCATLPYVVNDSATRIDWREYNDC
jgi:hypothetical protein